MGSRTPAQKCSICHKHSTYSKEQICYRCRGCPRVFRDGDCIFVGGVGPLTHDAALRLAHAIADALTP